MTPNQRELCCYLRRNKILCFLVGLLLTALFMAAPVVAMTCTTHTYYVGGRHIMCQTCCTNGMCNTTCF